MDEIFEDDERPCTPQDAANLKYLDCCIKETLRMYPSIPGVMRTITEDTEIGRTKEIEHKYVYGFVIVIFK